METLGARPIVENRCPVCFLAVEGRSRKAVRRAMAEHLARHSWWLEDEPEEADGED